MTSTSTLQIRSAIPSDYNGFVKLWPTLNDMNPPPLQERWEKEMMPTSLVAEHHGNNNSGTTNIAGYVWWTVTGSPTPVEGQIKYIMVDTSCRRQGVATALLQAVTKKFKEEYKCRRWRLHVRPENQPAVSLYRKLGLERMFGAAEVHLKWSCLSKLTWSSSEGAASSFKVADCLPVGSPEEEAALESAFALPSGVFREAREFGGRIPLQLRSTASDTTCTATESDGGQLLLGCCIFDPAFPGAYPFCVTRPEFAKPLLEEMEKHHDRARDDFFLLVENQETLIEALVAAGAKVEIDLDCYSGRLR